MLNTKAFKLITFSYPTFHDYTKLNVFASNNIQEVVSAPLFMWFTPVWTSRTVGDLSVTDVLEVGPRVVVAHVGAGVHLLQSLRSRPRRELGAGLGRDAAWYRVPHFTPAVGFNTDG